tara:strand:+ start:4021 stop:4809 length:789 start_codon:yes stop_codon:yes gene_type:complete
MPTTIPSITSSTRPGSPSAGDAYFETDTKNYIIYDGAAWRGFVSDGETLGANGYSLDLDGTDDRVELGNIATLNSASAFSLSFWVKLPSSSSSLTYFYQSGSDTFSNTISFYQSTNMDFLLGTGSNYAATRYAANIRDDQWHHLAGVYNGSTLVIYLDGAVPTQSNVGVSIPSSTVSTAGNSPHIGSKTDDSGALEGKMDDFSIFNAALTATEVSNIYNSRLYNPTKLIHQYRFENNYNDSKGSLNGTAQGDPTFDSSDKPY